MPDITEDTFSPQDWRAILKFLEGMDKRGLDLQVLTVTDQEQGARGPLAALSAVHAGDFSDSARIIEESRLVVTTDQGSAALAAAYGVPTLILAPLGVDRLRTAPRGDHVGMVEHGYPIEIKSENLVSAALALFA